MNKFSKILVVLIIILILINIIHIFNTQNSNLVEYSISDIIEYDDQLEQYTTPAAKLVYLENEFYISAFVMTDEETKTKYLINTPYITNIEDYNKLGKYGIKLMRVSDETSYKLPTAGTYVKCKVKINKNDTNATLDIISAKDNTENLSTKTAEYMQFMLSGDFDNIMEAIDNIPNIDNMNSIRQKEYISKMLTAHNNLENNFYQETSEIDNTIQYIAYIYANPNIKLDEEKLEKLKDIVTLHSIKWSVTK